MPVDEKAINKIFTSGNNEFTILFNKEIKKFKSFNSFRKFINDELEFWSKYLDAGYQGIHNIFTRIDSELRAIDNETDSGKIESRFQNIKNYTNDIYFLPSDTDIAQFLTRLFNEDRNSAKAAIEFLLVQNDNLPNIHSKRTLKGILKAYDLLIVNENEIEERIASERLDKIAAQHLSEIKKIKDDYTALEDSYKEELKKSKEDFGNSNTQFLAQTDGQKKIFEDELKKIKDDFERLRVTYSEKMRLKEPAQYWDDLKKEYDKKGKKWTWASIAVGGVLVLVLFLSFYNFPVWLKGQFTSDHLKGFIIFALIVSVFTYLLHLFVKLATSSFHLSRDATERLQLTHIYLALLNDKAIEPNEREIILQALFSRADTGLLKSDSSPTMPGSASLIENILKLKK